ncbi:MAG: AzlD domain-containing protein, partial [Anaerolineae bacterium]|nr:AzlD domain-containing protein [Anaerolineae bacterium]
MTAATLWLTLVGMGLITYGIRLSLILLLGRVEMPPHLQRALRLVPPAVLAAIIVPEVLRPNGALALSLDNPRLIAGLLAALIAWRTKNALLTIGAGMAALWL